MVFLARLRSLPPDVGGASPGLLRGTAEGIAFALRNRIARVLIVGLGLGVMFAAVDDVALVFLARDELGAGALGYGALASIYGVGFAAGSIALRRARLARAETAFVAGLFLTGVGGLLTGLAPVLAVAALTQAVAGSGNGLDVVATDTLVQREIPRERQRREEMLTPLTDKRCLTPLQTPCSTAALRECHSRNNWTTPRRGADPACGVADVGRADRSHPNHRMAWLACSRGLDLQSDDCWDGPLMLEIAGQHVCHG